MTQEEKTAFKSQRYQTYTTLMSLDSLEFVNNAEGEEEICMKTKIGYGSGHVHNDIAANAAAGYGLLYYTTVVGLTYVHAGLIFLIGNIIDAVAVITTGFLVDMDINSNIYSRYGQFKSWHLLGTIFLLVGYTLLFLPPLGIEVEEKVTAYYTLIFVLSNIGYAMVAISHNSIILKLAKSESNQVLLASIKTSGTAIACILIYVAAYFSVGGDEDSLTSHTFTIFVLTTSAVGAVASVLFHLLVKEKSQSQIFEASDCSRTCETEVEDMPKSNRDFESNMTKTNWLKNSKFHIVIILYAVSRTFFTVCLAYLVFYVRYTLMLKKGYTATVPLAMVLTGLVLSKPIKKLIDSNGLEKSFVFFSLIGGLTCIWIYFGCKNDESKSYEVFGISACLGISSYSMMVICLSLVATLIGNNLGICLAITQLIFSTLYIFTT